MLNQTALLALRALLATTEFSAAICQIEALYNLSFAEVDALITAVGGYSEA